MLMHVVDLWEKERKEDGGRGGKEYREDVIQKKAKD